MKPVTQAKASQDRHEAEPKRKPKVKAKAKAKSPAAARIKRGHEGDEATGGSPDKQLKTSIDQHVVEGMRLQRRHVSSRERPTV